jgi:uncharacterized protein (TIGR04255 family)
MRSQAAFLREFHPTARLCTKVCTVEGRPPILRKSPLQIVAAELRFPEAVFLPEDLKKIRRELGKDYPASSTEHGMGIELSIEGLRQQQTIQRHVYRTSDGAHQLGLTSTSLVLEGRGGGQYEGFERFLERWIKAVEVVEPIAEISTQIRLGLRYINQLPVKDASPGLDALDGRINPALLSPIGADGFSFAVVTSAQELRLANEYGKATLRHGLQVAQEGTPPAGNYLVDIDFYDDEIADFELDKHVEQLKLFNSQVWSIFRWSLTDEEYERLEPKERE